MRFLVDGYNVTMADDATRRLPRDEQRLALVRRLSVQGAQLLGRGRITVVFDGSEDVVGAEERAHGVEVAFSRGESADDVIVRLARSAGEPITLVSSDRELQARAQAASVQAVTVLGASVLFAEAPRKRGKRRGGGSTAGLPKGANRITEELKRMWLTDDEE